VERLLLESAVGHESIWSGPGQQVRGLARAAPPPRL